MRPYWAVIQDGFRQALRTWVLWVLLLAITLALLGAAPIGLYEDLTIGLGEGSVRDWRAFLNRVRTAAAEEAPSPSRLIWSRLPDSLRPELQALGPLPNDGDVGKVFQQERTLKAFREALNRQLEAADFHEPGAWRDVQLTSTEARELLAQRDDQDEPLSQRQQQRLNRLLIEAAYPDHIQPSPRTSLTIRYFAANVSPPLPVGREQFGELLRRGIVWLLGWVVGGAGIVVAILVTAPIIPQMFEPGSLHLLLSKPVSRSLLFLSKFTAGCAFILILAAYLMGGVWLILGARFGIWDVKLLWSVPIYTFVFAIYYSVSALAGVVYRGSVLASAIMSIALASLFWLACFLVGTGKIGLESSMLNKMRITGIVPAGDDLLAVTEMGFVQQWDGQASKWTSVFETEEQRQLRPAMYLLPAIPSEILPVGPVYAPQRQSLVTIQRDFRQGSQVVYLGARDKGWQAQRGAAAPGGTLALLRAPGNQILAVSSLGIFQLAGDPLQESKPVRVLGVNIPLPSRGPFKPVGPDPAVIVTPPAAIAMHADSGDLAILSRGNLTRLKWDPASGYQRVGQSELLEGRENRAVVMAHAGSQLVLAWDDGTVEARDAQTLEVRHESKPEPQTQPRFALAAPGGRQVAVVFHNGYLWLYDTAEGTWQRPSVLGQGDISAAAFPDAEHLLVADRTARVSKYALGSLKLVDRFTPKMELMEFAYRRVIVPLYTVFPKPGELNKTFQYLVSGQETAADQQSEENLQASRARLRPWAPVWSSLAFMVVVLLAACVYIERQQY
ncbi:MAG: ABC transporter permease [Pirellulaceae bacterium]|nr:ABC transporter permease [Pirellulaceae bacterium]